MVRYEEQMGALRGAFTGVFQDLVVSARSTPFSRRAILPHLPHLATVLGTKCVPTQLSEAPPGILASLCHAAAAKFSFVVSILLVCDPQWRSLLLQHLLLVLLEGPDGLSFP